MSNIIYKGQFSLPLYLYNVKIKPFFTEFFNLTLVIKKYEKMGLLLLNKRLIPLFNYLKPHYNSNYKGI